MLLNKVLFQKRKLTRFELNKLDNNNNNRIPQETVKEEEFTLFSFYSQIIGPSTPLEAIVLEIIIIVSIITIPVWMVIVITIIIMTI